MGHKRQHYVPLSYLQAWCDPKCPKSQAPYVWLTPADGDEPRKKSPKKILHETDMYTIVGENGERDLSIERSLSQTEGKFARIRRDKLDRGLSLTAEERAFVCMFVAAMYSRTKTYRQHLRSSWGRALEMMDKVEEALKNASPEQRAQMQKALSPVGSPEDERNMMSKEEVVELVTNPLQNLLPSMVQGMVPHLVRIPSVVMVAPEGTSFITSNTPCVWFDKAEDERPRTGYSGGLLSPSLEITMPLSPPPDARLREQAEGYGLLERAIPTRRRASQQSDLDEGRRVRGQKHAARLVNG